MSSPSDPLAPRGRSAAQVTAGSLVFASTRLLATPLAALAVAILARAVGVEAFGHLSLAFSLVAALNNLGDFGFGQVVVRDIAADDSDEPALAGSFVVARLTASLLLMGGALVFLAWAVPSSAFAATALIVVTLPALAVTNLTALAQARFRPHWQGLLSLGQAAIWFGFVALFAANDATLTWFGVAYLLAAVLHGIGAATVASRLVSIDLRAARRQLRRLLAESWPLGLTGLFVTGYYHLDQLLLYRLSGPESSGLYGAAYRYLDVTQVLPATLLGAALPVLSRLRSRASDSYEGVAQLALTLAIATSAPVAIVGVLLNDEIVRLVYGPEFTPAGSLLAILSPAVVPISVSYLASGLLIVARRQSLLGWVAAPAAVLNLVLNLLLIPRYGATGAAWITVATEVGVSLPTLVIALHVAGLRLPLRRVIGWAISAGTMVVAAVVLMEAGVHPVVSAAVGGAAYAAALAGTRALTPADVRLLLDRRAVLGSA